MPWVLDGPGVDDVNDVAAAIAGLLAKLPRARGTRRAPWLVIALSGEFVQCKRLFGLPPTRDQVTANALVREGAARFFRRTADDLITSELEQDADAPPMAAAFPSRLVREMRDACARSGVRLCAIVPAEPLATLSPHPDDPDEADLTIAWRATRSIVAGERIAFNALSERALRDSSSPPRVRAAAIAAAAAVALLLVAPLVASRVTIARASRAHAVLRSQEADALATSLELGKVSSALAEVGSRSAARRSTVDLLAHLAATLPAGAAITQLRVDSAGGIVTVLGPSADALVKGLAVSPLLNALAVVGPVTRERVGAREVDRLSVRFSHANTRGVEQAP